MIVIEEVETEAKHLWHLCNSTVNKTCPLLELVINPHIILTKLIRGLRIQKWIQVF